MRIKDMEDQQIHLTANYKPEKRIIVTGASGYIGSQLIRDLANEYPEHEIFCVDNEFKAHVYEGLEKGRFKFQSIDLTDKMQVIALPNAEVVFHLAAIPDTAGGYKHADDVWKVNYEGSKNIIDRFDKARIVFASTANIYGNNQKKGLTEDDGIAPMFPYANSKAAVENLLERKHHNFVIARFGTVYGWSPAVKFNTVVNMFAFRAVSGQELTVHGMGETWRPFVHVKDVCKALILMAKMERRDIFNVVEKNYTVKQITNAIGNVKRVIVVFKEHMKDAFSYNVSGNKLKRLGWKLEWDLEKGIKDIVKRLEGIEQ